MKKSVKLSFGFLLVFIFALIYFNSGIVSGGTVCNFNAQEGDACLVRGDCVEEQWGVEYATGVVKYYTVPQGEEVTFSFLLSQHPTLSDYGVWETRWGPDENSSATYCNGFNYVTTFPEGEEIAYCYLGNDEIFFYSCNDASNDPATCSDTDYEINGGLAYDVFGTVTTNSGSTDDVCVNSTHLNERYCSGTDGTYVIYECPYGCDEGNGKCFSNPQTYCGDGTVQTPNSDGVNEECDDGNIVNGDGCSSTCVIENSCSDTESPSYNVTNQGTTTANNGEYGSESCSLGRYLTEYWCDGGVGKKTTYDCIQNGYTGCDIGSGGCYVSGTSLKYDCEVCNYDAECYTQNCETDFSGNQKRCVPGGYSCTLDQSSNCGVSSGPNSATCSGNILKTCTDTGAWSSYDCGTPGCDTSTTPDECIIPNPPATPSAWWGEFDNLQQVLTELTDVGPYGSPVKLVVSNPTNEDTITATVKKQGSLTGLSQVSLNYTLYNGVPLKVGEENFTTSSDGGDGLPFAPFTVFETTDGSYIFTTTEGGNNVESNPLTVTTASAICGDGVPEGGEDCDPPGSYGQCSDLNEGYTGTWTCSDTCSYDTSQCTGTPIGTCDNDGICEAGEDKFSCPGDCLTFNPPETCNDGIQNQDETGVDCGGVCPPCEASCPEPPLSTCGEYTDATCCNEAPSSVAEGQLGIEGATCSWDENDGACYPQNQETFDGKAIGVCQYQTSGDDTCEDDGFLSYSWTGVWIWADENTYSPSVAGEEGYYYDDSCDIGIPNYGCWRYDPENRHSQCVDGQTTVPCPAQIQLSFFEWQNLVGAAILILLVYFFIRTKENRTKERVKSKTTVKSKRKPKKKK